MEVKILGFIVFKSEAAAFRQDQQQFSERFCGKCVYMNTGLPFEATSNVSFANVSMDVVFFMGSKDEIFVVI